MITKRQGDVLLIKVDKLPSKVKEMKRDGQNRIVLAYGEVTGHAHAIHDMAVEMLLAENGERYLKVAEAAALIHEEHSTIPLDPGFYHVRQQRQYQALENRVARD